MKARARLEELDMFLSDHVIAAVIAANLEFLLETCPGNEYVASMLGVDIEDGESDVMYHVIDTDVKVTGAGIKFIKGSMVRGRFVPLSHIDDYPIEKNICESCGINSYCVEKVTTSGYDSLELCNKCRAGHEDSDIRDTSEGIDGCSECSTHHCVNHTRNSIVA